MFNDEDKIKIPLSLKYPRLYVEKYLKKELSLEEAYAQCSTELLSFRMSPCRESEYIKNLEFQEKYLASIVVTRYMESKGYKLEDTTPENIFWKKTDN